MEKKLVSSRVILIIAAPGDLQAALQLLLSNLPDVEILAVAGEQAALGALARHRPLLVILDGDVLETQSPALLSQIKERWPSVRCLVLLNQASERQAALDSGADSAVLKGYPAARLANEVEQLLDAGSVEIYETESK